MTSKGAIPNNVASASVTAAALRFALTVSGSNRAIAIGDMEAERVYAADNFFALDGLILALNTAYPGFLDQETLPLPPVDPSRCWVCGCIEERACDGGCRWVGDDLCGRCVTAAAALLAGGRQRLQSYDLPTSPVPAQRSAGARHKPPTSASGREKLVADHPTGPVDW